MDVHTLIEIHQIEQLKYRYMRAVDTHDWELLRSTLTDDVQADYGHRLSFSGAEELVAGLSKQMDDQVVHVHRLHQPEITVDGDTATGLWLLTDVVIREVDDFYLEGACHYKDEYVRQDGEWLIKSTSYSRIYEGIRRLKSPGFAMTARTSYGKDA